MPPLTIFGRKWPLGTDDFVFPTFIDLVIRLVRVSLATVWLWNSEFKPKCTGDVYSLVFFLGFSGIQHLMIIVNLVLMFNSGRGGVMEVQARQFVPKCLICRLGLQILETVWTTLGTVWLYEGKYECSTGIEGAFKHVEGAIHTNWIFIGIFIFFVTLNFMGSSSLDDHDEGQPSDTYLYKSDRIFNHSELPEDDESRSWEKLWRRICCYTCRKRKSIIKPGFKEIGQMFAYVFGNCGLVISDLAVGLALVSLKQKWERQEYSIQLAQPKPPNLPLPETWNSISKINHFFQYSTAIHTLTAIYFQKGSPCNIIGTQLKYVANCLRCAQTPFILKGDCCCFCMTSSLTSFIKSSLPEKQTTLVHLSFKNGYFQSPFMVLIDHSTKSIVIVVRGTMSVKDVFTDVVGTSVPITGIPGIPKGFQCHNGFLQSGFMVKHSLDKLQVISQLKSTFPTYNLVTTGNSLGASIAILLAMMYRPKYPEVKCFAYATPSFLSMEAGEYCKEFVQSVIYGNDMVARISIRSVKNLLFDVETVLQECKTPKFQIQLQMMLKVIRVKKTLSVHFEDVQAQRQSPPSPSISPTSETSMSTTISDTDTVVPMEYSYGNSFKYILSTQCSNSSNNSATKRSQLCSLYPPGQILHITPTKHFRDGHGKLISSDGPRWNIRWAERTEFDHLIVRSRMLMDHQPARTLKALKYFNSLQV